MSAPGTVLADRCQPAVWSPRAAGSPRLAWALDDGDRAPGCRMADWPGVPGAHRGMRKLLAPSEERWECSASRRSVRRLFLRSLPVPGVPLPARYPLAFLLHPGVPQPSRGGCGGGTNPAVPRGGTETQPTSLHGRGGAEPRRLRLPGCRCPARPGPLLPPQPPVPGARGGAAAAAARGGPVGAGRAGGRSQRGGCAWAAGWGGSEDRRVCADGALAPEPSRTEPCRADPSPAPLPGDAQRPRRLTPLPAAMAAPTPGGAAGVPAGLRAAAWLLACAALCRGRAAACPPLCACSGTTVDCHGTGLRAVPKSIPRGTERL